MEFKRLFDNFDYESVREEILNRKMIDCNFTTVLWRIYLHCLPRDSSQWDEILDSSRNNYEKLIEQYTIDPYKTSDDNNDAININHPLSRDEKVIK
jgi:TBC1 domain family protein 5